MNRRVRYYMSGTEKTNEEGNFEVVDTIKYLGINLVGKGRDIFREEKKRLVEESNKTVKPSYSINQKEL